MLVSTPIICKLKNVRKALRTWNEPEAILLGERCDRLLNRIQRGLITSHCEVSTQLRYIIDAMEEILSDSPSSQPAEVSGTERILTP